MAEEAKVFSSALEAAAPDVGKEVADSAGKDAVAAISDDAKGLIKDGAVSVDSLAGALKETGVNTAEDVAREAADFEQLAKDKALVKSDVGKIAELEARPGFDEVKQTLQPLTDALAKDGGKQVGKDAEAIAKNQKSSILSKIANNPKIILIGVGVAGFALYMVITHKSVDEAAGDLANLAGKVIGKTAGAILQGVADGLGGAGIFGKILLYGGISVGTIILLVLIWKFVMSRRNKSNPPTGTVQKQNYYYF